MELTNDLKWVTDGETFRLYLNALRFQRLLKNGNDPRLAQRKKAGERLIQRYSIVKDLWEGLGSRPDVSAVLEGRGRSSLDDDEVLKLLSRPNEPVTLQTDQVVMQRVLDQTTIPTFFRWIGNQGYWSYDSGGLKGMVATIGTPQTSLLFIEDLVKGANNFMEVKREEYNADGTILSSKYLTVPSSYDHDLTLGIQEAIPRVLGLGRIAHWFNHRLGFLYGTPERNYRVVSVQSQVALDTIIRDMNDDFDARLRIEEIEGGDINIIHTAEGTKDKHDDKTVVAKGRYVYMIDSPDLLTDTDGLTVRELENKLIFKKEIHYELEQTNENHPRVFLCAEDLKINNDRVMRAGQVYDAPSCVDHYYYPPKQGILTRVFAWLVDPVARYLAGRDTMETAQQGRTEDKGKLADSQVALVSAKEAELEALLLAARLETRIATTQAELTALMRQVDASRDFYAHLHNEANAFTAEIRGLKREWGMYVEKNNTATIEATNIELPCHVRDLPSYGTEEFLVYLDGISKDEDKYTQEVRTRAERTKQRMTDRNTRLSSTNNLLLHGELSGVSENLEYRILMEPVVRTVKDAVPDTNIVCTYNKAMIYCLPEKTRLALGKLIKNAAEASEGGNVNIIVKQYQESGLLETEITICQSGEMSETFVNMVNSEINVETDKAHGHGIGIPEARRLLEQSHAGIYMESLGAGQGGNTYITFQTDLSHVGTDAAGTTNLSR
jgi:signal transduction histidine kinase